MRERDRDQAMEIFRIEDLCFIIKLTFNFFCLLKERKVKEPKL